MDVPDAAYIQTIAAPDKKHTFLECTLCHHNCHIPDSSCGFCGIRCNSAGKAELPYYGAISALAIDPIEKKPLYHFRPGTDIFSVGFYSCNFRCPFCQNWQISRVPDTSAPAFRKLSPEQLIQVAQDNGSKSIAFTYSEPLIHFEYVLACLKLCKEAHIASVIVSNGSLSSGAASELLPLCSALNIDIKSFSASSYKNTLRGNLQTVLDFVSLAVQLGVHTELTSLIIPDFNDSMDELIRCRDYIADLSPSIPWHLSAYHPAYKWNRKATSPLLIERMVKKAKERLQFVYAGNVPGEINNTYCPSCASVLVSRNAYAIDSSGLDSRIIDGKTQYFCSHCGAPAPFNAGN